MVKVQMLSNSNSNFVTSPSQAPHGSMSDVGDAVEWRARREHLKTWYLCED